MALPGSIPRRLGCRGFSVLEVSVNQGVEVVDAGGPIYAAFSRFPNPCLLHAKLPSGLCAGDRRTRTANTLLTPPVGDLIAGLP